MDTEIPENFRVWPGHTGNWHRWPNNRGAVNLITPEVRLAAFKYARTGEAVSCSRPLRQEDPAVAFKPAALEMVYNRVYDEGLEQSAGDTFTTRTHGFANTHIDALCHHGYKNYGFDGIRFEDMIDGETGANTNDVTDLFGIVTRGVFVDVPRLRGVSALEPGDCVKLEEIAGALERVRPGDALIIRTGVTLTGAVRDFDANGEPAPHPKIGGLHYDCLDAIGRAGVAVLGSDSGNDTFPVKHPHSHAPIHALALVFWGIPLVHNMGLEELGAICEAQSRDDFLFMINPLNLPRATGSACNPLAIL